MDRYQKKIVPNLGQLKRNVKRHVITLYKTLIYGLYRVDQIMFSCVNYMMGHSRRTLSKWGEK